MVRTRAIKSRLEALFSDIHALERSVSASVVQEVEPLHRISKVDDLFQGAQRAAQILKQLDLHAKNSNALIPNLQTLEHTEETAVGNLHLQNFRVSVNTQSSLVDFAFRNNHELVGVIVLDNAQKPHIVSRSKFYEFMGRQFGVAIFMERSIQAMLNELKPSLLVVPAASPIAETVQLALERSQEDVFEPILVIFPQEEYFLLDIYVLLQAQVRLLIGLQQQIQLDNLELENRVELRTAQLSSANSFLEEEIAERQRAQEKLDVRLLYEKTLTQCANSLLMEGDSHEVIQETLAHLIKAVGVSRVFILENTVTDELGPSLRLSNQVYLDGVHPIPRHLTVFPYKLLGDWLQNLWSGKYAIGQMDHSGPREKELMNYLGLFSLLLIPIGVPGNWMGVIGFGEIEDKRAWDENDIQLLFTVAQMLSSYYQRQINALELAKAHDEALQASQFKSELLAKVSHELLTPLGAVLGYTQLLQAGSYGKLTEDQKQATEVVISSSKYLTTLINGILDQAQLDNGSLILLKVPFNVKQVAQEVQARIRVLAESKGLEFVVAIDPDVPVEMVGDRIRLEQILTNLLSNAVKFTDEGQVKIHFRVSGTNLLAIQISDSGPGIPQNAQAQIFEKFVQVDGSPTRIHSGTGLGLSISKQLVEMMQGQIKLTSELGKGSVFTVELPILPLEKEPK